MNATTAVERLRELARTARSWATATYVDLRWRSGHGAPLARSDVAGLPVVVSLTSYPPRFPQLVPTLKSLLMQSLRPDHLELWIAEGDLAALPAEVLALRPYGLSIHNCPDLRSYKKIIPALARHPDALIVTADDDTYYWPTWLEELVRAYDPDVREVLCHRAHRIVLREPARPARYRDWTFDIGASAPSRTVFPTGVGGILYRPGIFDDAVSRVDLFQRYCPTADDVWLFWMASLRGALFRKVGPVRRFVLWPRGQDVALYNQNVLADSANDRQIAAMIEAYGFPATGEPA